MNSLPAKSTTRYALRPWHAKFAVWLADQVHPPITVQCDVASRVAGYHVTYGMLKHLRKRDDFRELVATIQQGGIDAARAILINDLPLYMELHRWGAERSKAKDDTRGLASYTTPALDRVLPKREGFAALQQNVTVVLTEKQLRLEESAPIEVTTEPISKDE